MGAIFYRLLFVPIFIITLFLFGCGKDDSLSSSSPVGQSQLRVLGKVTPSKNLSRAFALSGVDSTQLCFQVVQPNLDELAKLQVFDVACAEGSKPLAQYEMRKYLDPKSLGTDTGIHILYDQLLPVGEVVVEGNRWSLTDLCSIDGFYKSSCTLKVMGGRLVAIELNPAAALDTLRLVKEVEKQNRALQGQIEESKAAMLKLNNHLQNLSGLVQGQKEGLKANLDAIEPIVAKEEGRILEILKGANGQPGEEAALLENTTQVRELSEKLTALQKELEEPQKAFLAKRTQLDEKNQELNQLFATRVELKSKIAASSDEEMKRKLQDELENLERSVSEKVFAAADLKTEIEADFATLKATEPFKRQLELHAKLVDLKKKNGTLQTRMGQLRDKINAIQSLKNHLATAKKLLGQDKLKEVTSLLPMLGRIVERIAANPI